jgi:hypothetical protein
VDCKRREVYLFLWQRAGKSSIGNRLSVHHRIVSAIKRVEFVSDIVLRGRWCNIIVMNVHAPTEEKGEDSKTVSESN